MKGIIISSGDIKNYNKLNEIITSCDYILCADGGLRHAQYLNIKPDAVIGDFDSISEESIRFIHEKNIPVHKFPVEKDETDTELALNFILDKGCNDITLVGATGSRIDHTMANIFLLRKLLPCNVVGKVINDNNSVYIVNDKLILNKKEGYYISIIPITTEGIRISLEGFYYPLKDAIINFGSTLGVSNKIIEESGIITISEGEAIVIEARD